MKPSSDMHSSIASRLDQLSRQLNCQQGLDRLVTSDNQKADDNDEVLSSECEKLSNAALSQQYERPEEYFKDSETSSFVSSIIADIIHPWDLDEVEDFIKWQRSLDASNQYIDCQTQDSLSHEAKSNEEINSVANDMNNLPRAKL